MAEYIDRETVIKSLEKLCDRVCQYSKAQRKVMCSSCPLGDAFTVIEDDIPQADVRPVRRGRWVDENIYKQTMSGKTYDGFTYCSNCKHDFSFGYRSKFCPDC